jgi:hypothetical protein
MQPDSDVDLRFGEMKHGWVPRGDLSDPSVERDVKLSLEATVSYFHDKFQKCSEL